MARRFNSASQTGKPRQTRFSLTRHRVRRGQKEGLFLPLLFATLTPSEGETLGGDVSSREAEMLRSTHFSGFTTRFSATALRTSHFALLVSSSEPLSSLLSTLKSSSSLPFTGYNLLHLSSFFLSFFSFFFSLFLLFQPNLPLFPRSWKYFLPLLPPTVSRAEWAESPGQ